MKKDNQLLADLFVKPTDPPQSLHASSSDVSHCKDQYLSVKPFVLTEFVLKTPFLINDVAERSRLKLQLGKRTNP